METRKHTGPVAALAEIYPQLYLTPGEEGAMAGRFLGVTDQGYAGGRLENYAGDADLDVLARKVYRTLLRLERLAEEAGKIPVWDMALHLEADHPFWKELPDECE